MISVGQLFLNAELNEYLIVTKNSRGQISYAGAGFRGHSEDHSFIERFDPVNPDDVSVDEIAGLLSLCPIGTKASTGFISQET